MQCPHCGHALPTPRKFCTRCGRALPSAPAAVTASSSSHSDARAPRRKPRRGRTLRRVLLALLLAPILVAAGLYLAISRGWVSVSQVMRWFEPTPARIHFVNLTDGGVRGTLRRFDGETDRPTGAEAVDLESLEMNSIVDVEAARYRLEVAGPAAANATCTLAIDAGDVYRVFAVEAGVVLLKLGSEPRSAAETHMAGSPLCEESRG